MTNGIGWIALALTIFALWDPLKAIAVSFLFGAFFYLSFSKLQVYVAPELLRLMPYLSTIIALTVIAWIQGKRAFGAPEALGIPYQRGER
jgi:simple sugar transport system permease protein